MNRKARALLLLLTATAVGLCFVLPPRAGAFVHTGDLGGLLTFAFLAVFSEALATSYAAGNRGVGSSIAFIPLFACAIVFPPYLVFFVALAVAAGTAAMRRITNVNIVIFNISQYAISFLLASVVYRSIIDGDSSRAVHFVAFMCMAATFFLLNLIFVTVFMALRDSCAWAPLMRQAVGPGGGNLLYDLLASPVAAFAAVIYTRFSGPWLICFALPIFVLRHSYAAKLQLEKVNRDLLNVLIKAIETRDPYTSGHSLRVAALARSIGYELGYRRGRLGDLETAALLHDIGKIEALYATVISKPFELSEEERALIRTHPRVGAELLENLNAFTREIILAVRHHHERFDGSGYPDGLVAGDIPAAARVIMLSDSIDAMLSDRPYRRALSTEAVEAELRRCSGTQFDPRMVSVVLQRGTIRSIQTTRQPSAPALLAVAGGR